MLRPSVVSTLPGPTRAVGWRARPRRPELIRVTDRVYSAVDYAISNVVYVVTDTSVVVIDTTESPAAARTAFDAFRKFCQLPVSYIIYTHFHGDHTRGAKVFHTPTTKIIAQQRFTEEVAKITLVLPYKRRVDALQFGFRVNAKDRGISLVRDANSGFVPPDILFNEEYRFEEGGVRFELYHTQGETVDHLMLWLPQEKVLLPGDLFYPSFPMLSNPLKPDRPVLAWAESLERMRTLQPEYLVPSHSRPRRGAGEIDSVLANYARGIRHVHNETVKGINQGLPLEQIRRQVQLPQDLARLPYLQQRYGTVAWAVNGIFRQYTGWYSLNPTDLRPGPRTVLHRALLQASAGAERLIARARGALREGQDQLVLELTDIVLGARPQNREARVIRARALKRLGATTKNGVERNIYLTAAGRLAATAVHFGQSDDDGMQDRTSQASGQSGDGSEGGVSTDLSQEASSSSRGDSSRRRGGARPLDSTPFGDKVQVDHWGASKGPSLTGQLKQGDTITAVNRWYDKIMYVPQIRARYGGSDFSNYGYWEPTTSTLKEACENLMEHLLVFIPEKKGTILDVACGKGATTRHLLDYYRPADVMGINVSEKQLETCKTNAPGCRFLLMSATELAFSDNSFDNMICVEAAMHFNTREKFLSEAHRVLKPRGRLVLSDALRTRRIGPEDPLIPPQNYIREMGEYRSLYLRAGFEHVDIVDRTNECWGRFYRHSLSYLRGRLIGRRSDPPTFRRLVHALNRRKQVIGYYVLVCAQKTASH